MQDRPAGDRMGAGRAKTLCRSPAPSASATSTRTSARSSQLSARRLDRIDRILPPGAAAGERYQRRRWRPSTGRDSPVCRTAAGAGAGLMQNSPSFRGGVFQCSICRAVKRLCPPPWLRLPRECRVGRWRRPRATPGPRWDLRDIYPTDAAWEADRQAIQAQIPSLLQYQGKLGAERRGAEGRAPGAIRPQQARIAALHLCVAQGRRRPPRRGQPGAQEPGAGRVHGAGRGDVLGQSGNRRSRRREGEWLHRRRSRAQEVRVRPARRPSPGAAHPVARRGEVAGLGRNAACRAAATFATSSPLPTSRGRR